jgi:hypothetical protein
MMKNVRGISYLEEGLDQRREHDSSMLQVLHFVFELGHSAFSLLDLDERAFSHLAEEVQSCI